MHRGEIWTAAGGVHASKPRPALIVRDDRFGATYPVVLLPLTTHQVEAPLTLLRISAKEMSGISEDGFAMVDTIATVRRNRIGGRTGRVTSTQMVDVERAPLVFLGIAGGRWMNSPTTR